MSIIINFMVPPHNSTGNVNKPIPPIWKSGNNVSILSLEVISSPTVLLIAFQNIFSWVKTAPLGLPVVPDV